MQLAFKLAPFPPDQIQESFERFDRENPAVYNAFRQAARELVAAGRTRIGAKMIVERLRWETRFGAPMSQRPYKINNNFTSRYTRKLIAQEPDLAPFIETRRIRIEPR